jgi:hypothetical protein
MAAWVEMAAWVAIISSISNNSSGALKGAFFCGKMPLDRLPLETSHKVLPFLQ